jgi:L-serine dehydratase
MNSLRQMYKIGYGPSSSHTMGPQKAAQIFKEKNPQAKSFQVELWGSLAATGKGHLTDYIIIETLHPQEVEIIWKPTFFHPYHPNGMKLIALDEKGAPINEWVVFSIGGGEIREENEDRTGVNSVYPLSKFSDIREWCDTNKKELWEFALEYEGEEIFSYLRDIWNTMLKTVEAGISQEGSLPGSLEYPRKAKMFYEKSLAIKQNTENLLNNPVAQNSFSNDIAELYAYTLAASEENAGGGTMVTAPTCGASGVIPGTLTYLYKKYALDEKKILRALSIAGTIGNLAKENASISGAEAGCQAEVGVACSMAAAMACWLMGGNIEQIEYAAEMGLEHHLGLTCDPIRGYVQIPCIERNVVAAVRALDVAQYSLLTERNPSVSFDKILITMLETGKDLMATYRETSEGGLAKIYEQENK